LLSLLFDYTDVSSYGDETKTLLTRFNVVKNCNRLKPTGKAMSILPCKSSISKPVHESVSVTCVTMIRVGAKVKPHLALKSVTTHLQIGFLACPRRP
jgi:hypothetical protein